MRVTWLVGLSLCLIGAALWKSSPGPRDRLSTKRIESRWSMRPVNLCSIGCGAKVQSVAALRFGESSSVAFHSVGVSKRSPLMEMNEQQQKAAYHVLSAFLSEIGYGKSRKIMSLENVLRTLEGPASHERRNPIKYYFTFFGEPGPKGTWGLSIEGHHLSLNFVVEDGKIVDSTPRSSRRIQAN